MHEITLQATVRTERGKHTRSLRRAGEVPGIYYVHGEENIPIAAQEKSLKPLVYTSETHIINLRLNGDQAKRCIMRAVQYDPVTEKPIHFDLQGLREDEEITLEVPIIVSDGTPVGVRDGGILQQVIHRLKVFCLPKHIPEHIEVNAENLKINQFIHVRDLKIENVTIVELESTSIVGVVPPAVEKEPTPGVVEAEEAVEPEVISKGKKTEEEGAEGTPVPEKKGEASGKASPAAAKEKEEKNK